MTLMVGELAALLSLDNQPFERGLMTSSTGMDGLKRAATTAAIGIGAAMAGAAVYSLGQFSDFQAGMNEVFTLIPGMSQDAMDEMSSHVQSFATEFGVLPDKVIPGLYQAISAGVPPNNVFSFLETAQKLAAAGATDLETAVDGLTSVINAYGQENITAADASDYLFTAVRLGKTTVGEMSDALFQVTPIASSIGVGFDQISAAMSTLAAKSVPTSVAATEIRQALVELSDQGSQVGSTFADITGQTFRQFVAGGGTLAEALNMLASNAQDSGLSIADLFGSVEAGQAALSLTGGNADDFAANLAAMGDAAGATEQAYGQMTEGIRFQLDKLKAWFAVAAVRVGEQVARLAQPLLEFANKISRAFSNGGIQGVVDFLERKLGRLSGPMRVLAIAGGAVAAVLGAGGLVLLVGALASAIGALISPIAIVAVGLAALAAGAVYAYTHWEGFRNVVDSVVSWLVDTAWPWIQDFAANVAEQWGHLVEWTRSHWDAIQEAVGHVIVAIQAVIGAFVSWVQTFWAAWGDQLVSIAQGAWDMIRGTVENAVTIISGIIDAVLAVINGDWGDAWDAILQVLSGFWSQAGNVLSFGLDTLRSLLEGALNGLLAFWGAAWDFFGAVLSTAWELAQQAVSAGISAVLGFLASLPGKILSALASLPGLLVSLGTQLMRGLLSGISSGWGVVSAWFASLPTRVMGAIGSVGSILLGAGRAIINGLLDGMRDAWGSVSSWLSDRANQITNLKGPIEKDRLLLQPIGEAIIGGLDTGMRRRWVDVRRTLAGMTDMIGMDAASYGDRGPGVALAATTLLDQSTFVIVDSRQAATELIGRRARDSRAKASFLEGMH